MTVLTQISGILEQTGTSQVQQEPSDTFEAAEGLAHGLRRQSKQRLRDTIEELFQGPAERPQEHGIPTTSASTGLVFLDLQSDWIDACGLH